MSNTATIDKIVDAAVASAKPPAFWRYIRVVVADGKPVICNDAFWASFDPWKGCNRGDEDRSMTVRLAANKYRRESYGDSPGDAFPAEGILLDVFDFDSDTPRNQVGLPIVLNRTSIRITRDK